jgi:hypothetical protein
MTENSKDVAADIAALLRARRLYATGSALALQAIARATACRTLRGPPGGRAGASQPR